MVCVGVVSSKWMSFSAHGRMDAQFWIKVGEVLKARSIDDANDNAVKAIVQEVEERKEFPAGSAPKPMRTHIECPKCLSWDVDAVEITTVSTKKGIRATRIAAQFDCQHCKHAWETTWETTSE